MSGKRREYGGPSLRFKYLTVFRRAWTDGDHRRFTEGGFTGVRVEGTRDGLRRFDLEPLLELRGLHALEVLGPIRSDRPIESLTDLRHLALLHGTRRALDLSALTELEELTLCGGREYHGLAGVDRLAKLALVRWSGGDLTFLGSRPALRFLRVEARGQAFRLDGLEGSRELDALMVLDGRVSSLAPVGSLSSVRSVYIVNEVDFVPDEPIDLEPLSRVARTLEEVRLANAGALRSLSVVRRLTSLQTVALIGAVSDGDMSPLIDLPSHVDVGMVADHPHHSHTDVQIRCLRQPQGPTESR